eukprot:EG_transcript_8146
MRGTANDFPMYLQPDGAQSHGPDGASTYTSSTQQVVAPPLSAADLWAKEGIRLPKAGASPWKQNARAVPVVARPSSAWAVNQTASSLESAQPGLFVVPALDFGPKLPPPAKEFSLRAAQQNGGPAKPIFEAQSKATSSALPPHALPPHRPPAPPPPLQPPSPPSPTPSLHHHHQWPRTSPPRSQPHPHHSDASVQVDMPSPAAAESTSASTSAFTVLSKTSQSDEGTVAVSVARTTSPLPPRGDSPQLVVVERWRLGGFPLEAELAGPPPPRLQHTIAEYQRALRLRSRSPSPPQRPSPPPVEVFRDLIQQELDLYAAITAHCLTDGTSVSASEALDGAGEGNKHLFREQFLAGAQALRERPWRAWSQESSNSPSSGLSTIFIF